MNQRERYQKIMNYEKVDKVPFLAVEPYEKTAIERWIKEGLIFNNSIEDSLCVNKFTKVPVSLTPHPRYEHKIHYEDSDTIIEVDTTYGAIVKKLKVAPSMYYGFIDHQVKTMDDWKRIKYRYEASDKT